MWRKIGKQLRLLLLHFLKDKCNKYNLNIVIMFIIIIIIIYAVAVVVIIRERENKMLESVPRTHRLGKQECF
jgi:hypothetical protein